MSFRRTDTNPYGELGELPLRAAMEERDALRQEVLSLRKRVAELSHELGALRGMGRYRGDGGGSGDQGQGFGGPPTPLALPAPLPRFDQAAISHDSGVRRASFDPLETGPTASPDQGIDFGAVARLSPEQLDKLPYGLITLDATGRVVHYNDTESRLVGLPKNRVVGRPFFGEIAPCTRVREFEGRFFELARDPARVRVVTFDFVFRFSSGDQAVSVVITPSRVRGQFHVALLRRTSPST